MSIVGFVGKEGRTVKVGQKVRVYRNLNKPNFFSIQDAKTKLVLGYAPSVTIGGGVQYTVGEKSRQRVLRDKRRNVHAYAVGMLVATGQEAPSGSRCGYYNLYHTPLFIVEESGKPLLESQIAHCQGSRVFFM